uniref:Uncharacterized protein n=1 Tax=Mycena chlorophos TaxID=658473 RepID=A0ABQ0LGM8_MYCCL|nr:predicted protein [Mycena chlorophos]
MNDADLATPRLAPGSSQAGRKKKARVSDAPGLSAEERPAKRRKVAASSSQECASASAASTSKKGKEKQKTPQNPLFHSDPDEDSDSQLPETISLHATGSRKHRKQKRKQALKGQSSNKPTANSAIIEIMDSDDEKRAEAAKKAAASFRQVGDGILEIIDSDDERPRRSKPRKRSPSKKLNAPPPATAEVVELLDSSDDERVPVRAKPPPVVEESNSDIEFVDADTSVQVHPENAQPEPPAPQQESANIVDDIPLAQESPPDDTPREPSPIRASPSPDPKQASPKPDSRPATPLGSEAVVERADVEPHSSDARESLPPAAVLPATEDSAEALPGPQDDSAPSAADVDVGVASVLDETAHPVPPAGMEVDPVSSENDEQDHTVVLTALPIDLPLEQTREEAETANPSPATRSSPSASPPETPRSSPPPEAVVPSFPVDAVAVEDETSTKTNEVANDEKAEDHVHNESALYQEDPHFVPPRPATEPPSPQNQSRVDAGCEFDEAMMELDLLPTSVSVDVDEDPGREFDQAMAELELGRSAQSGSSTSTVAPLASEAATMIVETNLAPPADAPDPLPESSSHRSLSLDLETTHEDPMDIVTGTPVDEQALPDAKGGPTVDDSKHIINAGHSSSSSISISTSFSEIWSTPTLSAISATSASPSTSTSPPPTTPTTAASATGRTVWDGRSAIPGLRRSFNDRYFSRRSSSLTARGTSAAVTTKSEEDDSCEASKIVQVQDILMTEDEMDPLGELGYPSPSDRASVPAT